MFHESAPKLQSLSMILLGLTDAGKKLRETPQRSDRARGINTIDRARVWNVINFKATGPE